MENKMSLKDKLAFGLFWSWNLIFVAFMFLGFAPNLLPEMLNSVRMGLVPMTFLIYGIVLSLVPVAAVIIGLTALRSQPGKVFALGYVVEGPLMLILVVRFFLIRQATPGLTLVIIISLLGMGSFLWYLLKPRLEPRAGWAAFGRLLGMTLMLLTSIYASLWIAFYAVPMAAVALDWLWTTILAPLEFFRGVSTSIRMLLGESLIWIPFSVLGFLLALYTATLVVVAPIAVPFLSARAWWDELNALAKQVGRARPAAVVTLTTALSILFFVISNQQPQRAVFALLETPPGSLEEANKLLEKEEVIREGLLNAYLAPYRYISAQGEVRHVREIYANVFDLTAVRAYEIQQAYESVAQPLLYKPVHEQILPKSDNQAFQNEPLEAARQYQQFFDTPIVEGERQQIVRAVRTTWNADRATAAWQAVDDREVYLVRQEVQIQEHGDWANIEIYEEYSNQTGNRQEVIYYFNLPESAVLTGVWLGNSADRGSRFDYRVAPRGAAQAVYRNETRINRDPALLEQIGPRQYRLRVFPILPLSSSWDSNTSRQVITQAPSLHMWLNYRTFAQGNSWPLPKIAELRNVYWDDRSVRTINGIELNSDLEAWLPDSIPASNNVLPVAHRIDFENGMSVMANPVGQGEALTLNRVSNMRLAVVLDRSYSMSDHTDEVSKAFEHLEKLRTEGAEIDIFLTASRFRGEAASRVPLGEGGMEDIVYFGGQNAAELLTQYAELKDGQSYDAVLVFTDGSGYELGESEVEPILPEAPIWMVHLGGEIPLGYDDNTLDAIQASGGGVSGDLNAVLMRMALKLSEDSSAAGVDTFYQDVLDGYKWTVISTADAEAIPGADQNLQIHSQDDDFSALAARQLILAETARQGNSITNLETLDFLHSLAKTHSIVTPYSSMIVLVEARQENLLDQLEKAGDRYDREYEPVSDTLPATEMPLSGVPEPHEWLLIGMAVAILIWYATRSKFAHYLERF